VILDHNFIDNSELAKLVPYEFVALSLIDNSLEIHDEQDQIEFHLSSILAMKQLEILNLAANSGMYDVLLWGEWEMIDCR
jgi:hypothetical protein